MPTTQSHQKTQDVYCTRWKQVTKSGDVVLHNDTPKRRDRVSQLICPCPPACPCLPLPTACGTVHGDFGSSFQARPCSRASISTCRDLCVHAPQPDTSSSNLKMVSIQPSFTTKWLSISRVLPPIVEWSPRDWILAQVHSEMVERWPGVTGGWYPPATLHQVALEVLMRGGPPKAKLSLLDQMRRSCQKGVAALCCTKRCQREEMGVSHFTCPCPPRTPQASRARRSCLDPVADLRSSSTPWQKKRDIVRKPLGVCTHGADRTTVVFLARPHGAVNNRSANTVHTNLSCLRRHDEVKTGVT